MIIKNTNLIQEAIKSPLQVAAPSMKIWKQKSTSKGGFQDRSILETFVEKNGSSAATDAKEDSEFKLNKNFNVDPKNDWGEDTGLTNVDKQNCEVKHERVKDVAEDETSALAALVFRISFTA